MCLSDELNGSRKIPVHAVREDNGNGEPVSASLGFLPAKDAFPAKKDVFRGGIFMAFQFG
jgi:hypothetical protein